jgi:heat-inducible transcriptional repressor
MTSPPVSELTERARSIFRLVVEGYLDSGSPVGSKTLAEGGISLSPASIRSVLSGCRPSSGCACSSTR